jgi:hypothetical protein
MSIISSKSKRKIICDFGINDSNYITNPIINGKRTLCPFYSVWVNMIRRCYGKGSNLCYENVYVDEEWKYFSIFKSWMEKQDWEKKCLDKDILYPGNKIYCYKKCIFVSQKVNKLLLKSDKVRGNFPLGVSYNKKRNSYMSYYNYNSKLINLGWYNDPFEAHRKFQLKKSKYILEVADEQSDKKLKTALIRIANNIIYDYKNYNETTNYY